jgi:hypothetical protein
MREVPVEEYLDSVSKNKSIVVEDQLTAPLHPLGLSLIF